MSRARAKPTYKAPALEKGLEILEFLSAAQSPCTMTAIAAHLGRSKHEIYRMLVVLEEKSYITHDGEEGFSVTNKLFELGMRNPPTRNLLDVALPHMRRLAEALGQSCQLAVRSGTQIVVIARVESPLEIGLAVRIGYRRHVVESTSGRVLYAFQPKSIQEKWLPELAESAPQGFDMKSFLADTDRARTDGCIAHESHFVDGVVDIGAPVFDQSQDGAIASLTVPFMLGRYTQISLENAVERVRATAGTISSTLRIGR